VTERAFCQGNADREPLPGLELSGPDNSASSPGLPPGLELSGPDYYPEVDANGEAVIPATIQPHGAAEATQYYLPRFRAWDNSGSDALSPFVALAATDFRATSVWGVTASYDSTRPTSINGFTWPRVYHIDFVVSGVGSYVAGRNRFLWTVYDVNTGVSIVEEVNATAPAGTGPLGAWSLRITSFWVYVDAAGNVAGLERSAGTPDAALRILIESPWLGINWTESNTFYVTAR
jgi:hypothetical protein